ncbi:hypothetical protein V6N12_004858 [Hibiscus sabdariffa]|uniref:RNase H type-1 domain-containing protein n=1 Tax=Hibiscus sabdariffa TaxID=183260 RepID=A0ABR2CMR0_9ROSI
MWFVSKVPGAGFSVDSLVTDPLVTDKSRPSKAIGLSKSMWSAPPAGFLNLNVDGAMLRDGSKGGIGGILRDNVGDQLASFSLPFGLGPPILAELEAINYGLDFFFTINNFDRSRLILESDSAIVIEWCLQPSLCPNVFISIVRKCNECINENSVIIRLILRTCNVAADALAKAGIG